MNATCTDTDDAFNCVCNLGFGGNGTFCSGNEKHQDYHQVGNTASFVLTGAMCMISKIIRNVIKDAMCCGLIYGVHFLIKCCGCKQ